MLNSDVRRKGGETRSAHLSAGTAESRAGSGPRDVASSISHRPVPLPRSKAVGWRRSFTVFPEIGGDSRQFADYFQERRGVDGCRAWVVFIFAFLLDTFCLGIHFSYGLFYLVLQKEFPDHGRMVVAAVGSVGYAVIQVTTPLLCVLNYGRGQWPLVLLGGIAGGGSLLMTSYMTDLMLFFVSYSLLFGISTSLMYSPSTLISNLCFLRYRPMISGVFLASGCTGVLAVLPACHILIERFGWQDMYRILAGFTLIACCSAITYSWMKRFSTPDDFVQDASKPNCEDLCWEGQPKFSEMLHVLTKKRFLLWLFITTLAAFVYYIPYVMLLEFMLDFGVDLDKAIVVMIFLAVAGLPSRIVMCRTLDVQWLNKKMLYMAAMIGSGLSLAALPLVNSYSLLIAFAIMWGVLESCLVVLSPAVTVQVMGWQSACAAWNVMHWVHAAPLALGPVLIAWYRDYTGSYDVVFYALGIVVTMVALLSSAVPSSDTILHHTDSWPHVPPHDATYHRLNASHDAQTAGGFEDVDNSMGQWHPGRIASLLPDFPSRTKYPATSSQALRLSAAPRHGFPPGYVAPDGAVYGNITTRLTSSSSEEMPGWERQFLVTDASKAAGEGYRLQHVSRNSAGMQIDGFYPASTSTSNPVRNTVGEAGDRVMSMPIVVDIHSSSTGANVRNFIIVDNIQPHPSTSSRHVTPRYPHAGSLCATRKSDDSLPTEEVVYTALVDEEIALTITGVQHSSSVEGIPVGEAGDAAHGYPTTQPRVYTSDSSHAKGDAIESSANVRHVRVVREESSSSSQGTSSNSGVHSIESIRVGVGVVTSHESTKPLIVDESDSATRIGGGGNASPDSLQYITAPSSVTTLTKSKSAAPETLSTKLRRQAEETRMKLAHTRRVWSAGGIERRMTLPRPSTPPTVETCCIVKHLRTRGSTVSPGGVSYVTGSPESDDKETELDGSVVSSPPQVGADFVKHVSTIQLLKLSQDGSEIEVLTNEKEEQLVNKKESKDKDQSWVSAAAELVAAMVKGGRSEGTNNSERTVVTKTSLPYSQSPKRISIFNASRFSTPSPNRSSAFNLSPLFRRDGQSSAEDCVADTPKESDPSMSPSPKSPGHREQKVHQNAAGECKAVGKSDKKKHSPFQIQSPDSPRGSKKNMSPAAQVVGLVHSVAMKAVALVRGQPPSRESDLSLECKSSASDSKPQSQPQTLQLNPTVITVQEAEAVNKLSPADVQRSSSSGVGSSDKSSVRLPSGCSESSVRSQRPGSSFPLDIMSILNLLEMVDECIVQVAEQVLRYEVGGYKSQKTSQVSTTSSSRESSQASSGGSRRSDQLKTHASANLALQNVMPKGIIMVAPTGGESSSPDLDQLVDRNVDDDSSSSSDENLPDETKYKRVLETSARPDPDAIDAQCNSRKLTLVRRQLHHVLGKREVHSAGPPSRLHGTYNLYSNPSGCEMMSNYPWLGSDNQTLLAASARSKSLDALLWLMSTQAAVVNTASLKREVASASDKRSVLNLLRNSSAGSVKSHDSHDSNATLVAPDDGSRSSPSIGSVSAQLVCKEADYRHVSTDKHSTINLINFSSSEEEVDGKKRAENEIVPETDPSSGMTTTTTTTSESSRELKMRQQELPITVVESEGNFSSGTSTSTSYKSRSTGSNSEGFSRSNASSRESGGEDKVRRFKPDSGTSASSTVEPNAAPNHREDSANEEAEMAWWPFSSFIPEARGTAFANLDLQSLVKCYPFFGDIGVMTPEDIANILLTADAAGGGGERVGEGSPNWVSTPEDRGSSVEGGDAVGPSAALHVRSARTTPREGDPNEATRVSSLSETTESSNYDEDMDEILSSASDGRQLNNVVQTPRKQRRRKRRKKIVKQIIGW